MFGIGMPEMLLILAVALIVIGPKKLPDLAKSLGKALGEFKKATNELKDGLQIDSELKEVKTSFDDINRELKDNRPVAPKQTGPPADNDAETETAEKSGHPHLDSDPADELKTAPKSNDDELHADVTAVDDNPPDNDASGPGVEPSKA
jgi:TatA/E family protein of Tat protein translocase